MENLLSLLRMHWDHEPSLFLVGADLRRLTFISDGNQSLLTSAPTRFMESGAPTSGPPPPPNPAPGTPDRRPALHPARPRWWQCQDAHRPAPGGTTVALGQAFVYFAASLSRIL